jgi:DNA replication and repair protein RecF
VHLIQLRIQNLRNIDEEQIDLEPGVNLFVGPNGAGKTSILEAAHLLSHGRSFRTHQMEQVQRRQTEQMALFAQIHSRPGEHRLGLQRRAGRWAARIDGDNTSTLSELFSACAVVCFEPGSHALISGGAELRRSFVDWGVFHVEPDFVVRSRRYRRALRQRNALLKQDADDVQLAVWDAELAEAAEPLAGAREEYMGRFAQELSRLIASYLPELGTMKLRFRAGWDRSIPLMDVLHDSRVRDRALGHTTRGPHRADWSLSFDLASTHEQLSRGQEKLCAIACTLAQATLYRSIRGEWPIIALDDFCSELDFAHQQTAIAAVVDSGAQILLTGTEIPVPLLSMLKVSRRFHVEQGKVQALL